jgi:hypothetical protein
MGYATKTYEEEDVSIHDFLTSPLVRGEWSGSHFGRSTPRVVVPRIHWVGGWMGPRYGLDDVEKREILPLVGLGLTPLVCPACSQSLYRLSYPGPNFIKMQFFIIDIYN